MAEAGNPAIALLDSQLRQEGTTTTDGLTLADHFDFNGYGLPAATATITEALRSIIWNQNDR